MKKTLKTMLALMAGALTFAACSNDDIIENVPEQQPATQFKHMIFTATQEQQGGASRAAIATGDVINWTSGDKIAIFDGKADEDGNFVREFKLTAGVGSTSGTFEGKAATDASAYYGIYPCVESVYKVTEEERDVTEEDIENLGIDYWEVDDVKHNYEMKIEFDPDYAEDYLRDQLRRIHGYEYLSDEGKAIVLAYIKGEKIKASTTTERGVQRDGDSFTNIILPAEQTATAGSADKNAMLMIAKSTDNTNTMEFKNVCAYVEVKPQFNCSAIYLLSNGGEQLAGTLTVNYKNGAPTTTVTENGTNEVVLKGTITAGNTYFIAVRPETLSSGFTIEFITSDYYYARSSNKDLGLTRNEITELGTFSTDGKWTYKLPTSGTDSKGREWKLITPTLRVATVCPTASLTPPYVSYNDETFKQICDEWTADGWTLMSWRESGNIKSFSNGIVTFNSRIVSHSININHNRFLWIESGTSYSGGGNSATGAPGGLFFKYVGE